MTTFNLQKNNTNIAAMSVWYEKIGNKYELKYNYVIRFAQAYALAKTYKEKADAFVTELDDLRDMFYKMITGCISCHIIPKVFDKKDLKPLQAYDMTEMKIIDDFLPYQIAFAKRWGLLNN